MPNDDDDISHALSNFQRGPKREALSDAELDARVKAMHRFFAARLAHLREAHKAPRRVCPDCGMSGTGRCRRHDDEREL